MILSALMDWCLSCSLYMMLYDPIWCSVILCDALLQPIMTWCSTAAHHDVMLYCSPSWRDALLQPLVTWCSTAAPHDVMLYCSYQCCMMLWDSPSRCIPCQYLCGTILVTPYSMVWDWRISRAGPMPFYILAALSLFVSCCFDFLFFHSKGWYCGAGVFELIGC